ncbi:hypothetical protein ACFL0U_02840 [Pseudomonadota bacterium]
MERSKQVEKIELPKVAQLREEESFQPTPRTLLGKQTADELGLTDEREIEDVVGFHHTGPKLDDGFCCGCFPWPKWSRLK